MQDSVRDDRTVGRRPSQGNGIATRFPSLQSIPEDDLKDFDCEPRCIRSNALSPTNIIPFLLAPRSSKSELESSLAMDMLAHVDHARSLQFATLHSFQLSPMLMQAASQQATAMARIQTVFHSVPTIQELQLLLASDQVAENVQRGDSIPEMHAETMHHANAINRSNILSPYFVEFGCAVSVGDDGKLYSCQLFRSISPAARSSFDKQPAPRHCHAIGSTRKRQYREV
jgi:hypothetical protein